MYFHTLKFLSGIEVYLTLLGEMLSVSWCTAIGNALGPPSKHPHEHDFDESVQFFKSVRAWMAWKPESLATWLVCWLLVPFWLLAHGSFAVWGALFKTVLWLIFLVPAILLSFLTSIRFDRPSAHSS